MIQFVVSAEYHFCWICRVWSLTLLLLVVYSLYVTLVLFQRVGHAVSHLGRQLQRLVLKLPDEAESLCTVYGADVRAHLVEVIHVVGVVTFGRDGASKHREVKIATVAIFVGL